MMKYKKHCSVFIITLMFFLSVTLEIAFADAKSYKNYGKISLGANQTTGDLDDAGYGSGVHTNVNYGRYLSDFLVVEGTIGTFLSDQTFSGRNEVAGHYDRDDEINVTQFLGTIKGEVPVGPVSLFGGAGIGGYAISLESEIDSPLLGDLSTDDSDFVFGTHIVLGGQFNVTDRIFVGIEGIYRWTEDADMKETVGTVPVQFKGDLNGYALGIMGGYRF